MKVYTIGYEATTMGEFIAALKGAIEALDLARWDDLPEAELPWDEIEIVARRQSISEADVIWDLSGKGKKAPAAD